MRQAEAALSNEQRFRIAKARSERLLARGTWNEADHPREPAGGPGGGQFAGGGGGNSAPDIPDAGLDPAVVDVGGDAWNKQTAKRLEREYQGAKPKLEALLPSVAEQPDEYDPLNKTSGDDYRKTQNVASMLSLKRVKEVLAERGIEGFDNEGLKELDRLWSGWKRSSAKIEGQILQLATADELGGRLNTKISYGGEVVIDREDIIAKADDYYKATGGYKGVRAYVRAKWEATQFLLDKAGQKELLLFRSITLDQEKLAQARSEKSLLVAIKQIIGQYAKVPNLAVTRNGAISTSVNPNVANDWGMTDNRLVLRITVPRTAAVSIPAYGKNLTHEQEVVIAGTAWKNWSAWLRNAPAQEPMVSVTPKSQPIEIDILEMELSNGLPHWLDPVEKNKGSTKKPEKQWQVAPEETQRLLARLYDESQQRAKELLARATFDDYRQDPKTGLLQGSDPEGGSEGSRERLGSGEPRAPLAGSEGHPALISSRRVTAKTASENSERNYLRVDVDALKGDPENYEATAALFRDTRFYPNMRRDAVAGDADSIIDSVKHHMKANLRWLHETTPEPIRGRAANWYPGANTLAREQSDQHKIPLASAAAVYARLSPRREWEQNVELGNRVINIYMTQQKYKFDDAMAKKARELTKPDAKTKKQRNAELKAFLPQIKNKTLGELESSSEQAAWIRLYNEAHLEQTYRTVTPEGKRGGLATNMDGAPTKLQPATLSNMAGAIDAIKSNGDRVKISKILGDKHKVRSFYNNILDPDSANDDNTVDTHQVGAAWLQPFGGGHGAVLHNLKTYRTGGTAGYVGAPGSAKTGIQGTYPVYADAVRELAAEMEIHPRALQSVTWTAKIGRFDNASDAMIADVAAVWNDYRSGKIEIEEAHERIDKIAPFTAPRWAQQ